MWSDAWSEALAERCCQSTTCYHSGFRKKSSWTSENKHPALTRHVLCTASFSSAQKLSQEGSKICQCLAEKSSQPYRFCCGLLELHASDALAAVAPCCASSICVCVRAP